MVSDRPITAPCREGVCERELPNSFLDHMLHYRICFQAECLNLPRCLKLSPKFEAPLSSVSIDEGLSGFSAFGVFLIH